jgi:hypothetical protein
MSEATKYSIVKFDTNSNHTYFENSEGTGVKHEFDAEGNTTYYETSDGSEPNKV